MTINPIDRRRRERFVLAPGSARIAVRPAGARDDAWVTGDVRDMSDTGVRGEVPGSFERGRAMEARIEFTAGALALAGETRGSASFHVLGTLVWAEGDDAAIEIKAFARPGDRGRLIRRLSSACCLRAA